MVSRVKRRLRTYDIITAGGLVLLLLWTPIYMAQAPGERDAVGGTEFVLPSPRYGDHFELEIVVQTHDHGPVTTGPVVSFDFRRPEHGDHAPEGTVLVEERRFSAQNLDLGAATFLQDARAELRFYGSDGSRLGTRISHHTYISTSDHVIPPVGEKGDQVLKDVDSPLSYDFGGYRLPRGEERVVYEAKPTWEAMRKQIWIEHLDPQEGSDDDERPAAVAVRAPTDEKRDLAPFAARHRDHVLYAKEHFEEWYGHAGNHRRVSLGIRALDLNVEWKEPVYVDAPRERWAWFSRDLPLQAGEHHGFYNSSGRFVYSVDLVPVRIERGDLELRFTPRHDVDPSAEPERAGHVYDFSHDEPFLGDISLRTVGEWLLAPTAPTEIRTMVAAGGLPAGVAWGTDGTTTTLLAAVAHEEHLRAVEIQILRGTGDRQMTDACSRNITFFGSSIHIACETPAPTAYTVHSGLTDGISPAALPELRHALQDRTDLGGSEIGSWSPALSRPLTPEEGKGIRLVKPFAGLPTHRTETHASWNAVAITVADDTTRVTASTTDESTFHFERYRLNDDTAGYGQHLRTLSAPPVDGPRIIHPLGPEPAYGGLALVALGLLIRFLAALKSGAHLPLLAAFYAKITKDKVLDHAHRETIHQLVANDPGVTIDEVAAATDLSRTAAFHHLQTLERNGAVKVTTLGRMRHYFPTEWVDPKARLRQAVARHEEWEHVLRAVESKPGVPLQELVAEMARSKTSISRAGSRLSSFGLVRKERAGRELRYYPLTPSSSPSADRAPSDRAVTATSRVP